VENAVLTFVTVEDIKTALGDLNRLQRVTSAMFNKLDSSITLDKLKKITILGSGTFGQVWLMVHKETSETYALKIQTKRELIESGQAAGVVREKNLMASIDHPFVVKLVNAFQDKDSLFMVMKLAQGGELFSILHTDRTDGVPEASARFYAANIYDGLMHMHGRRILYRDLKPENVLIDQNGYCLLIDLGFAKVVTDKTYTLCGTPLYLAPEIILSRGYDKSVDNWAFGVLVYEMIFGNAPFYTPNMDQMKLFKRIVKVHYKFPDRTSASAEAKDMISKILVLHPSRRLGSFAGGGDDIRNHPWLTSITPSSLLAREVQAPWKPKIKSPTDTSNFDNWDHLQDKMTVKYAPLSKREQQQFDEF
jgi:protein kinase A